MRLIRNKKARLLAFGTGVFLALPTIVQASWYPYRAEAVNPPFTVGGKTSTIEYTPLVKATNKWSVCVSFPHMKDAYWLGVDYGVVEQAQQEGVKMELVEAGGYTNLSTQISQD
jgi:periplasmic protein TorT